MSATNPLPLRVFLTQDGLPPTALNPLNIFAVQIDGNTRTWFAGPLGTQNWLLDSVEIKLQCDGGVVFPNPSFFRRPNNLVNGVSLQITRNVGAIVVNNLFGNVVDGAGFRPNSTSTLWSAADDFESTGFGATQMSAIGDISLFFYQHGQPLRAVRGERVEFVTRDNFQNAGNISMSVLLHVRVL